MSKILNFGSLNLDFFYSVDHFVRPGETLSSTKLEKSGGGKGLNQSIALARAGAAVWHAGCVGSDGKPLLDLLEQSGADISLVRQLPDEVSGQAIIQRDKSGQNCILLFGGANRRITEEMADAALSGFGPGDILLLQNEVNLLPQLISRAAARGVWIVLNPSPISDALFEAELEKVGCFILNEIEGEALSGETKPDAMLAALRRKYPAAVVVLTLGKAGVLYEDGKTRCSHGIYEVPVVDTTGAGDTLTGYFLACTAAGETPAEALRLASVASSLAVMKKGAAPSIPTMAEVRAARLSPAR